MVLNVQSLRKRNNMSDKSYIPRTFSDKVTLAVYFTDDPGVPCECDVLAVKNCFEDDSYIQMIKNKF